MSLYADRVYETTDTTGTGAITLDGAVAGYVTFTSKFDVNDRFRYLIERGAEWEIGEGVMLTSTTFDRVEIFSSSNAGALVSFAAGTKKVLCLQPAQAVADIGLTIAFASLRVPQ